MGFDFIVIAPLLPSHCGFSFVFGCGVSFFGEFQCLPDDDFSAVSCNSGALARGSESMSFYSAILNQFVHLFPLKDLFQIQLHREVLGVKALPYEFWGDAVKPITPYNSVIPTSRFLSKRNENI